MRNVVHYLIALSVTGLLTASASGAVIDDTLSANNQANLSADAGQTFTVNIDTATLNAVGSPHFGQKLSTIAIEGPQGGASGTALTLEVYTDADGVTTTWDPGTLVATSTNAAALSPNSAIVTYNFSSEKLAPGAVYAFTYTNGAGTRVAARPGLTSANDIPDGSVFSAGAIPGFGDGFDTAMTITANESIVLDHVNLPSLTTAGSQATFEYQTFTSSIGGLGTTDTVSANSPLEKLSALETISFVRAPSGNATGGSLFIDIYTGSAGDDGIFLGSSLDSVDINSASALEVLTWSFGDLLLNSADTYSLVFSTNSGAGGTTGGRVAAANNGAGFFDTYTGGFARGPGDAVVAFDTLFAASFFVVPIPEPSAAVLFGLGIAGISAFCLRRRRGRV